MRARELFVSVEWPRTETTHIGVRKSFLYREAVGNYKAVADFLNAAKLKEVLAELEKPLV